MNTTFKPRLIFFDIDETLHRKATQFMPDSVCDALKAVRAQGIHTAIATGRTPASFPAHIRQLFTDGLMDLLVSVNGQYNCYYENTIPKTISSYPLKADFIHNLTTAMRKRGWDYASVSEEILAVSADSERVNTALKGIGGQQVAPDYALNHDIYQMLLFINAKQTQELIDDEIIDEEIYELIRWHPLCIDVFHRNGAKSRGIYDICAALNIPLAETMAFGDGLNDIEMISAVGFGVAMGDAREEVKAVARYITGTVEEDGIAHALRTLGVI